MSECKVFVLDDNFCSRCGGNAESMIAVLPVRLDINADWRSPPHRDPCTDEALSAIKASVYVKAESGSPFEVADENEKGCMVEVSCAKGHSWDTRLAHVDSTPMPEPEGLPSGSMRADPGEGLPF